MYSMVCLPLTITVQSKSKPLGSLALFDELKLFRRLQFLAHLSPGLFVIGTACVAIGVAPYAAGCRKLC